MQEVKRRAAQVWASRARAEAQSAARFQQIARDLQATAAPQVLIDLSEQAAAEEATHVELCLTLVQQFGHATERPAIPHIPSGVKGLSLEDGLLLQIVGMCCINETVSAAILAEMLRNAETGLVHDTIQEILRDEIGHGRIGWAHLAHVSNPSNRLLVSKALPTLLENAVNDELFEQPDIDDPDLLAAPFGAVPRVTRFAFFEAALLDLVFPGLERFEVDTQEAKNWLRSRSGAALSG